jgi:hypothetical protein
MRKAFGIVLSMLVAAIAVSAQTVATPKWVEYKSADGGYTVMLPTKPNLTRQDAKSADGKPLDQYLATASEAGATMMIGYFDYVGTYSFDKGRDGLIAKINGKLVSEAEIKLGPLAGRSVVANASAGGYDFTSYVRFYDAGSRVYVVQFLVLKTDDTATQATRRGRYFDSFKILTDQ